MEFGVFPNVVSRVKGRAFGVFISFVNEDANKVIGSGCLGSTFCGVRGAPRVTVYVAYESWYGAPIVHDVGLESTGGSCFLEFFGDGFYGICASFVFV